MLVKYEDIVADPMPAVRRIVASLELPVSQLNETAVRRASTVSYGASSAMSAGLGYVVAAASPPPPPTNTTRWQAHWSNATLRTFWQVAWRGMAALDY